MLAYFLIKTKINENKIFSFNGVVLVKNKKSLFVLAITILTFSFGIFKVYTSVCSKGVISSNSVKEETTISSTKENKEKKTPVKIADQDETKESIQKEPVIENQEIKTSAVAEASSLNNDSFYNTTVVQAPTIDILETIKQNKEPLGTAGRLFLSSADFSVAIYSTDLADGNNAQIIVDRPDSAAYFQIHNQPIIADHNHQGFYRIIDIKVGEKAYIKNSDGQIQVYTMINKFEGMNLEYDLTDLNEKSVLDGRGDLILYTCYKSYEYANHVMITIWKLEQ